MVVNHGDQDNKGTAAVDVAESGNVTAFSADGSRPSSVEDLTKAAPAVTTSTASSSASRDATTPQAWGALDRPSSFPAGDASTPCEQQIATYPMAAGTPLGSSQPFHSISIVHAPTGMSFAAAHAGRRSDSIAEPEQPIKAADGLGSDLQLRTRPPPLQPRLVKWARRLRLTRSLPGYRRYKLPWVLLVTEVLMFFSPLVLVLIYGHGTGWDTVNTAVACSAVACSTAAAAGFSLFIGIEASKGSLYTQLIAQPASILHVVAISYLSVRSSIAPDEDVPWQNRFAHAIANTCLMIFYMWVATLTQVVIGTHWDAALWYLVADALGTGCKFADVFSDLGLAALVYRQWQAGHCMWDGEMHCELVRRNFILLVTAGCAAYANALVLNFVIKVAHSAPPRAVLIALHSVALAMESMALGVTGLQLVHSGEQTDAGAMSTNSLLFVVFSGCFTILGFAFAVYGIVHSVRAPRWRAVAPDSMASPPVSALSL